LSWGRGGAASAELSWRREGQAVAAAFARQRAGDDHGVLPRSRQGERKTHVEPGPGAVVLLHERVVVTVDDQHVGVELGRGELDDELVAGRAGEHHPVEVLAAGQLLVTGTEHPGARRAVAP